MQTGNDSFGRVSTLSMWYIATLHVFSHFSYMYTNISVWWKLMFLRNYTIMFTIPDPNIKTSESKIISMIFLLSFFIVLMGIGHSSSLGQALWYVLHR